MLQGNLELYLSSSIQDRRGEKVKDWKVQEADVSWKDISSLNMYLKFSFKYFFWFYSPKPATVFNDLWE